MFIGMMKHKGCYTTSKSSVLINRISMTVQEHVRKAMPSMERSVLFHHHFVKEITTPSIQFSLLMDLLLSRSLKAVIKLASGLLFFLPFPYLVAVFSLLYTILLYLWLR